MRIDSIQIGLPREVEWQGKTVSTGIFKESVPGPVWVEKTNIRGDGQADLEVHGGIDKAVYAYPHDSYAWWKKALKVKTLAPGAFGENLTVATLDETKFFVGDRYVLGGCELEVAEPRFPCFKLGIKFNDVGVLKTFMKSGRPGIYFRVIQEGEIKIGDELKLRKKAQDSVSIADFFRLKQDSYKDKALLRRLAAVPALSEEWREKLKEKA